VDVKDWSSPVAAQFKIHQLPSFVLFDWGGKQLAEGQDAASWAMQQLDRARGFPRLRASVD